LNLKKQTSKSVRKVRHPKGQKAFQFDLMPKLNVISDNTLIATKLTRPRPTEVLATYWRFAKLRQDAFFACLSPGRAPIQDPVIQRYRFTNVYRAADRISQYLIRHVLYNQDWSPIDLVFRLLVFKLFNKIETWEAIESSIGLVTWDSYSFESYSNCLDQLMAAGHRVYSAAYIMPSGMSEYGFKRKHKNHLKVVEAMMKAELPRGLAASRSLEAVFRLLCSFPTIGPFIGYQFAIDLNYSRLLSFSENDFVQAGPGALDGISKCFSDLGDFSPADVIRYMVDEQDRAFEIYAPGFKTLWGRRLHLIDCQNLFCEVGKYSRAVHPEVRGSSGRTRIKQLYRPSDRLPDAPWFPPKWGINEHVELTR
jgi:hypothetical protein